MQPQPWPLARVKRRSEGSTAASTSAPGRRMFGDLPPSSSTTFLSPRAAWVITCLPTLTEPVNDTMSTPSDSVSACPAAGPPITRLRTPGGSSASSAIRMKATDASGVLGEGMITVVHPAARAPPILNAFSIIG